MKKLMWSSVYISATVILNLIQILIRYHFDFYKGDVFVSFLIGGWIGIFLFPLLIKLWD